MFDLTTTNTDVQTMTSLEFLTQIINPARMAAGESNLRNAEILRKIEDECEDLGGLQIFSNPHGTDMKYYILTLEQMTLVGMRESKAVRRSVLQTLKNLQRKESEEEIMMRGYMLTMQKYEALQLENKQQAQALEEAAPKVEFVGNYVDATGLMTFREMCKFLSYNEREVRDWLVLKGHMYKLNGGWAFSSEWLKAKRGEHKVTFNSLKVARISAQFTPKGFVYISERISK